MVATERSIYLRLAVKDAEQATAKLRRFGEQGLAELDRIVQSSGRAAGGVDGLGKATDQLGTRGVSDWRQFGDAGAAAAARTEKAAAAAGASVGNLADRMQKMGGAVGLQKGGLSNVSFQLQDIAVQAQAGTNWLTILVQQGGQIAGAFGPAGAAVGLVGTALLVAGGAYAAFSGEVDDATRASDLFKEAQGLAKDSIDDSIGSVNELAEAFRKLSDEQERNTRQDLQDRLRTNKEGIEAQKNLIRGFAEPFATAPDFSEDYLRKYATPEEAAELRKQAEAAKAYRTEIEAMDAGGSVGRVVANLRDLARTGADAGDEGLHNLSTDLGQVNKDVNVLEASTRRAEEALRILDQVSGKVPAGPVGAPVASGGAAAGPRAEADAIKQRNEAQAAGIRLERQALEDGQRRADQAVKDLHEEAEEIRRRDAQKKREADAETQRRTREKQQQDERIANFRRNLAVEKQGSQEIAAAYGRGAAAVEAAQQTDRARQSVLKVTGELTSDLARSLLDEALAAEQAAAQVDKLKATEQQRSKWAEEDARARERAEAEFKRIDQQLSDRLRDQAERQADLVQEPILQAARNIQSALGDAIYDGLNGELDSVGDFFDSVIDIGKRTLAQLMSSVATQPLLAALSGQGGAGGGGGMFGNLSYALNTSGLGQSINGVGSYFGLAGAPGAAGGWTDQTLTDVLGAGAVGYGVGSVTGSLTGGTQMGSGIGGTLGAIAGNFLLPGPLGTILGGAAGGFLGGLFGNDEPSDMAQGLNVNTTTGLSSKFGQTGDKYSRENANAAKQLADQGLQFVEEIQDLTGGVIRTGFEILVGSRDGLRLAMGGSTAEGYQTFQTPEELQAALFQGLAGNLKGGSGVAADLLKSGRLDFSDPEQALKGLGLAQTIEELQNPSNALRDTLQELGKQMADATALATELGLPIEELTEAGNDRIAAVKAQARAEIDAYTGSANMGQALLATIRANNEEAERLAANARTLGDDTGDIVAASNRKNAEARASAADRIEAFMMAGDPDADKKRAIKDVREEFQAIFPAAKLLGFSLEELREGMEDRIELIKEEDAATKAAAAEQRRQNLQGAQESAYGAADNARGFFRGLLDPIRSLRDQLGADQPGGRQALFGRTQADIADTTARAQRGELDAIQRLPALLSSGLEQARGLFASGPEYQKLARQSDAILAGLESTLTKQQRAIEKEIPAAFERTTQTQTAALRRELQDVGKKIDDMRRAIQDGNLQTAFAN